MHFRHITSSVKSCLSGIIIVTQLLDLPICFSIFLSICVFLSIYLSLHLSFSPSACFSPSPKKIPHSKVVISSHDISGRWKTDLVLQNCLFQYIFRKRGGEITVIDTLLSFGRDDIIVDCLSEYWEREGVSRKYHGIVSRSSQYLTKLELWKISDLNFRLGERVCDCLSLPEGASSVNTISGGTI